MRGDVSVCTYMQRVFEGSNANRKYVLESGKSPEFWSKHREARRGAESPYSTQGAVVAHIAQCSQVAIHLRFKKVRLCIYMLCWKLIQLSTLMSCNCWDEGWLPLSRELHGVAWRAIDELGAWWEYSRISFWHVHKLMQRTVVSSPSILGFWFSSSFFTI